MTQEPKPTEPAEDTADDYVARRAAEAVSHLHLVFGRTIRRLRELHMMSHPDLAASLGISEVQLEAIEAGETSVTPQVRAKLELIFGAAL